MQTDTAKEVLDVKNARKSVSYYLISRLGSYLATSKIQSLEKENARLIVTAEKESQRAEAFLREISHDLRNSLASVLTGTEVLLSINPSPDSKPLLQSIHRQANVIAQIIDRLMIGHDRPNSPSMRKTDEDSHDDRVIFVEPLTERKAIRILAIDDRRDVLLPLRVLLTKEGHEIAEAEDGLSGLEKVATFRPEIVLCDIDLPGNLSGLDVARNICTRSDRHSIYLVAISGNEQARDLENSAKAGFDFHIAKPITATLLRNLIYNRPKFADAKSNGSSDV